MAMGSLSDDDDFNPEINTTPLVAVMLVLLIVFMLTIPVMNDSVKINLPRAAAQPDQIKPQTINLSIDAHGQVYWNSEPVDQADMLARMAQAAKATPQPELHLRADRSTPYEKVAQVMAAAQNGGLTKMGFVTDPGIK